MINPDETCTGQSVGVVVRRGGEQVLLLDNAGVHTMPGGHVSPGETPEQAVVRHLESVGLFPHHLNVVRNFRQQYPCGPHAVSVFETSAHGAALGARWVTRDDLAALAEVTRRQSGGTPPEEAEPSLDPVWVEILTNLGWFR